MKWTLRKLRKLSKKVTKKLKKGGYDVYICFEEYNVAFDEEDDSKLEVLLIDLKGRCGYNQHPEDSNVNFVIHGMERKYSFKQHMAIIINHFTDYFDGFETVSFENE